MSLIKLISFGSLTFIGWNWNIDWIGFGNLASGHLHDDYSISAFELLLDWNLIIVRLHWASGFSEIYSDERISHWTTFYQITIMTLSFHIYLKCSKFVIASIDSHSVLKRTISDSNHTSEWLLFLFKTMFSLTFFIYLLALQCFCFCCWGCWFSKASHQGYVCSCLPEIVPPSAPSMVGCSSPHSY